MPVADTLKPYEGPPARPENFTAAFPQYERAIKKGVQELDEESQRSRQEILQQMRMTPPKPATIVNFHPWPLTFGAINRFLRGITVPACEPGMPYAYQYVRGWRMDWEYNENGSLKFKPILPIQLAAEFMREFSTKEAYGCGVLVYEGDTSPDRTSEVETYDPLGRIQTNTQQGYELDEENNKIPSLVQVPIRARLLDLIKKQTELRNRAYMARVRKADHDYKLPDGRGKWLINDTHLLMAQVLFAEGQLQKLPDWNLTDRIEAGLAEHNCPACMASPRVGAFKCGACGHILSPLAAYKNGAIEFGHASFEMMSSGELEEAEEERLRREQVKKDTASRMKDKRKAAKEAASAEPAPDDKSAE